MTSPVDTPAGAPAPGPRMRFHVDAWDPTYGSSVETTETVTDSTAKVTLEVECDPADWKPVSASVVPEPSAVLFVDGIRRVDARVWIDTDPVPDPATGVAPVAADAVMALCASYAAGVVCCCPGGGAHLLESESRRGLFTTATNAVDIPTSAGTYEVHLTPDDPATNLAMLLSEALQRQLAQLELVVSADARAGLDAHGVAGGDDLLVVDGPLRGRTMLPRALGFIKSHRSTYLPAELHAIVATLAAGERTPVFLMGTAWDRHSWYLRLPCIPGAPWAGVVRVECSADIPSSDAVALANLSQVVLPKYASCEYKDARAPQNLVPVGGLEKQLRHRLGHPGLMARALRIAASAA